MFTSMLDASFMKPRPDGELRPDRANDARPLLTATELRAPRFMAMDARVAASDWRAPRWDAALAMDGRGDPRPATTDWRAAPPPTAIEARATPRTDWRADDGDGDRLGSSSPRRVPELGRTTRDSVDSRLWTWSWRLRSLRSVDGRPRVAAGRNVDREPRSAAGDAGASGRGSPPKPLGMWPAPASADAAPKASSRLRASDPSSDVDWGCLCLASFGGASPGGDGNIDLDADSGGWAGRPSRPPRRGLVLQARPPRRDPRRDPRPARPDPPPRSAASVRSHG